MGTHWFICSFEHLNVKADEKENIYNFTLSKPMELSQIKNLTNE